MRADHNSRSVTSHLYMKYGAHLCRACDCVTVYKPSMMAPAISPVSLAHARNILYFTLACTFKPAGKCARGARPLPVSAREP